MILTAPGISGQASDFYAWDEAGDVWRPSLAAFVAWSDADYAAYRIAATEKGTSGRFNAGAAPEGAAYFELRARGASLAASFVIYEQPPGGSGGSGGGSAGPGGDWVTLGFYAGPGTSNPIVGAEVWVSTDAGGDDVVAGVAYTDSAGTVRFLLDAGTTYYKFAQADGYNAVQGEAFVAVADE